MDLAAPFTGTLFLPDKAFLNSQSPVLLDNGQTVAHIQWRTWTQRFTVLDSSGKREVAECMTEGFFRRRFIVLGRPGGRTLVSLRPGSFRPFNGAELAVAGKQLRIRQVSMWSDRRFEFFSGERLVGRIEPTTSAFTMRPDSYAFEVVPPADMSALEAIGLAQAVRAAARGLRQSHAASHASVGG